MLSQTDWVNFSILAMLRYYFLWLRLVERQSHCALKSSVRKTWTFQLGCFVNVIISNNKKFFPFCIGILHLCILQWSFLGLSAIWNLFIHLQICRVPSDYFQCLSLYTYFWLLHLRTLIFMEINERFNKSPPLNNYFR